MYFVLADLTTLLVAFIISVRAGSYIGSTLWRGDLWLQIQALWLYMIVTTAIWYLPVAGWLLVVSAWAKRAVMLWSILPPLAADRRRARGFSAATSLGDQIASAARGLYGARRSNTLAGADELGNDRDRDEAITTPVNLWRFLNPAGFFSSPETWIGAAVGVALIVGAIQLRMRRAEI